MLPGARPYHLRLLRGHHRGRTILSRVALGVVSLIFIYTTLVNIYERPEGLKISCIFIFTMVFLSLVSRAFRSTELRITVELDRRPRPFLPKARTRPSGSSPGIRVTPQGPRTGQEELRQLHGLVHDESIYFIEVERGDTSEFTETIAIQGSREGPNRVLHARSPAVANAIAALLIELKRNDWDASPTSTSIGRC